MSWLEQRGGQRACGKSRPSYQDVVWMEAVASLCRSSLTESGKTTKPRLRGDGSWGLLLERKGQMRERFTVFLVADSGWGVVGKNGLRKALMSFTQEDI